MCFRSEFYSETYKWTCICHWSCCCRDTFPGLFLLPTWQQWMPCSSAQHRAPSSLQQGARSKGKQLWKLSLFFWSLIPTFFFSPPIPNYKLSSWEAHSPPSLLIVWQKREAAVENALGLLPDLGLVCATINGRSATLLFLKNLISLGFMAIAQIGLLVL